MPLSRQPRPLAAALNLDDVLSLIIEAAVVAFPVAEKGMIHLYDKETNKLVVKASKGYTLEVVKAATVGRDEGRAGWVFEHGRPLVIDNIQKNEELQNINVTFNHPEVNEQKSTICVPLSVKGKVIGTISLDNFNLYNAFTTDDIELLSTFADQVAISIENAQLFEQIQRDLHIANNFYEISSKLYPTHDPNESLKLIATQVKEVMGALSVSITALDTAGRPYEKTQNGYQEEQRFVRTGGLSRIVMRTGDPYVIPDVTKVTVSVNPGMIKSGVKAAICLPLQSQGRNVGVMWVTHSQPHDFTDTEIKLLGLLANHAGAFVETAHLFQERQFLLETSKIILSAQNLDECLQTMAELMIKSLSATTFCYISILDDTNKKLIARATYSVIRNLKWDPEIGRQYPLGDSPEEAITINTGQIQILQKEKMPKRIMNLERTTQFQGELKSAVLIPLSIGENVFGVITMGERRDWERGSFTLERVGLYQAMAGQVAGFIDRMRLLEQIKKAQDRAKIVAKVTVLGDKNATLSSIASGTQEIIGCDAVTLFEYDQMAGKLVHPPIMVGVRYPDRASRFGEVLSGSLIYEMLQRDDANIVQETAVNEMFRDSRFVREEQIRSCVAIPLKVAEQKVGLMFVNYRSSHHFTANELYNVELFANQAAVAIRNAQLYNQVRKRAEELSALHEAGQTITSTLTLDETLGRIAEQALYIVGVSDQASQCFSHITLLEGNTLSFVATYPSEMLEKLQKNFEVNLETNTRLGIAGRTAKTGKSQCVSDVYYDSDYVQASRSTKSQLSVPLIMSDNVIGVLSIEHPSLDFFSYEDVRNVKSLASQAAIAIQNAQLYKSDVFVLMPFAEKYKAFYEDVIKKTIIDMNLTCKRADDFFQSSVIMNDIMRCINEAEIIIADFSGRSPNVFLEVGIAHALRKNVILMAQDLQDIPPKLQIIRCHIYKDDLSGAKEFPDVIRKAIFEIKGIDYSIFPPKNVFRSKKNTCLALLPSNEHGNKSYTELVLDVVNNLEMECVQAEEIFDSNSVLEKIWNQINRSEIIIADLTDRDPDVFYLAGLAYGLKKKSIFISQRNEDVPFDLKKGSCLIYSLNSYSDGKSAKEKLDRIFKEMSSS